MSQQATTNGKRQSEEKETGGPGGWNGGPPQLQRSVTPGGHTLDQTQPAFPIYHRKFANPAPLGLCAFAATTFVLSLINVQARGVTIPNIIVGISLAYGGLAQFMAGMWEFAAGNTFGATAFSSYGTFWMSFGLIYWPNSGIVAAYSATPEDAAQLGNAVGFYLCAWIIFTFMMLVCTFRASVGLIVVFSFLEITFILLAIGNFGAHTNVIKAGGGMGLATAFAAWYVAFAGLLTADTSFFVLPVGPLTRDD